MNKALVCLPLLAVLGGCASALVPKPPAIQADWLTVSGRHALPKADGSPYAGGLRVAEVVVTPTAAAQMSLKKDLYRTTLRSAVEKSLANYGWLGTGPDAMPVTVEAAPLGLRAEPKSTAATAELRFRPANAASGSACLRRDARAEFKALSPMKSGGGQRAFGWVAGIALAALSGPTGAASIGQWIAQNDQNAGLQNAAMNAKRQTAFGEGVAPSFDKAVEARFAGTNATQLAVADYIVHLGRACGTQAPLAR